MSGDYSRITFDPWQNDLGVLLQQGRPLSDAEWNALALQLRRRIHAGTLDTIGPAVVPLQTPDGFKITINAGNLEIGRGRIYVDGLLAENHGVNATKAWEPRLEELIGTQPVLYTDPNPDLAQPYYPNLPALPSGGPHLIYLDVWQREVTHLIRPELIEKAVGVDSTTRLQTVWQVKLLNNVGTDVDCSTPLDQIPGWLPANAPSAGRLSTSTAVVPGEPDPCLIPPGGGYKGLENQLYRIEIHTGGGLGTATFKWSRDNASVETRITHIPALNQLTVESIGKDSVLRFSDGDWVEITDDWLELHNQPGELRRIIDNGVDDATRTIILDQPLTAGLFPTDAMNRTHPGRHTRIKRWDQRGEVLDQNGNLLQDLALAAATGEITVPAGVGVSVLLEHGIIATFTLDPAGGQFKPGDYWVFAARSADATIEELDHAPPRGIHHHYAKLGFVTFPGTISDCRIFWPPPIPAGGDNCACTVCVTPQDHASGQPTIQMAIDQVIAAGGGTVCLEVGNYPLQAPVLIEGARSVKLVGKGIASRLVAIEATGAVVVNKSQNIVLDSFSVLCRGSITAPQDAMRVVGSDMIHVAHLAIRVESESPLWAAFGLADALMDISLRENAIMAPNGIRSGSDPTGGGTAGLADVRIENNTFECSEAAVRLAPISVHQLVNRICGNRVIGCQDAGFILTGITTPGFGVEIASNVLSVLGHGIVASMSGLSVLDNDILQAKDADPKQQRGIFLVPGPTASNLIADCQVLGNRIQGFDHAGIFVVAPLRTATIKQNQVAHVGAGLVFESPGVMDQLSIENNQFDDVNGSAILAKGEGARYAATGNQIRARGADPAVIMEFETGDGVFSHNECYRDGGTDAADVILQAGTLVVGNNRVVGGGISLELHVMERHYTVLGNICRGKIVVLPGGGLPTPWAPLNLEGVV